MKIPLFL